MKKILILFLLLQSITGFSQGNYLELIRVTDNVYVFKPKIDWTHSNCTVIVGADGLFIIDTFMQTNYADEAVKRLKEISALPVKYVFNTHGHADHVIGNSVFKAAFPTCSVIMNDSTFTKYPRNYKYAGDRKLSQESIPELEKELAEGKTADGYVLTESLKTFWQWQIDEAKAYVKFFKPIKPVNADIVFSDTLTFHFGSHKIMLIPVAGEGHDVGDAMAWLPKDKILIAGDVVVGPTPYAIRGRVKEMIQSLQQILDLNPNVVIPGHGEVQQGSGYVKLEQELFSVVQQKSLEAIKQGIPYKEAVTKIVIPADLEQQFTGNDDVKRWALKSFFTTWTIYGTYKQAGALPKKG